VGIKKIAGVFLRKRKCIYCLCLLLHL